MTVCILEILWKQKQRAIAGGVLDDLNITTELAIFGRSPQLPILIYEITKHGHSSLWVVTNMIIAILILLNVSYQWISIFMKLKMKSRSDDIASPKNSQNQPMQARPQSNGTGAVLQIYLTDE